LALGLVISASHNPAEDNGIKYFSSQGGKLPDAWEAEIEYWLETQEGFASRSGCEVGCVAEEHEFGRQRYQAMLEQQFKREDFAGQAVILDLAHGALTQTAPEIFAALGCRVAAMNNAPDGKNINLHCGSCHLEGLINRVKASAGAAIGMAFDGDGDRVMLVDEQGQVVNGDRVLGLLASAYHQRGALPGAGVAATVMSNLGLEKYLESLGIRMLRTAVGDRYVAEAMAEQGLVLGGEQSGHILLPRLTPTGDGLLTALEVLRMVRCLGATLHALTAVWQDYPQILINIPVSSRPELLGLPEVARAHQSGCAALGSQGRINLRYSGTENLARVMVEARDQETCRHWAGQIADAVQKSIGSGQARKATWLTCA
jgi:phosphoglucosamine mutase